ncbi:MAG: T9SS type A sorting domain-containing protein [Cytophagales bacterium]
MYKLFIVTSILFLASCNAKFKEPYSTNTYISVYPNITQSVANVYVSNKSKDIYEVKVFDPKGKIISNYTVAAESDSDTTLDLIGDDGVFWVVLKTNTETITKKIIKYNAK